MELDLLYQSDIKKPMKRTSGGDFQGILRFSPRIVLIASLLVFLITNKVIALRFAGYFVVSELTAATLKKIFGLAIPDVGAIRRPENGGNCMGCGTTFKCSEQCIDVSNQVGMPSGHSLTMAMSATFWSMWIWKNGTGSRVSKLTRCSLLILLALLVIGSRTVIFENCHTVLQVTVGSILGIGLGIGFYYLDLFLQQRLPNI